MNGTEDSDDDFIAATQVSIYGPSGWASQSQGASTSGLSYRRISSTQRAQNHGSSQSQQRRASASSQNMASAYQGTSSQRPQGTSSQTRTQVPAWENSHNQTSNLGFSSQRPHGVSQPQSQEVPTNSDRQQQLAHLATGMKFLQDQIAALSQSDPKKDKKEDKKKKPKESHKCQLCPKVLANVTNLTRHYKGIHNEFNLAKFGFTVNDTILNIDDSMSQDHSCGICGYTTADKNALDTHTAVVHRNDLVNNKPRVNNDTNNNVVQVSKDKMYKCEECSCYFDDKTKFDEHMKSLHGYEVLCKVCNKNFRFKDFESHVKDKHPDVYDDKDVTVKNNVIDEKTVRTKKGRAIVFKCNKCTEKFVCKKEAWRHMKMHKKEVRRRDVGNSQAGNTSQNREDVNTNNEDLAIGNIIYVCEICDIATASYDVVVEHSQKHITNPDIQFSANYCDKCCLQFEPICYEKHNIIHYTNKNTNKESFVYLKYKHHLLLTDDWLKFFDMGEDIVNSIVGRSIYGKTRSIKMRVILGKSNPNTLYQCRQCDNFVDPAEVRTHAVHFDTCVQIRTSFICNICERSFSSKLARDSHETVHNDMNDKDSFRIVIFNDDKDREFNHILNNITSTVDGQVTAANNDKNNATEQVIYKCVGCSLCFVAKESANNHIKACPNHRQKKICRICDNWFNMHELVDHYYEHHCKANIRLIINDIVPDVVLISDDESNNEDDKGQLKIRSGDEKEGNKNETINVIDPDVVLISDDGSNNENEESQLKNSPINVKDENDKTKQSLNADIILDNDNLNKSQTGETGNVIEAYPSVEENIQTNLLVAACSTNEPMDEDDQVVHDQSMDGDSDHFDFDISHDDVSQSTIINGECHDIPNADDVDTKNEIKCVDTNLLMNPFHLRNGSESILGADERNDNLAAEIETTRLNIGLDEINVKKEIPWYEDTEMNWRRVNHTVNTNVTSTDTIIDLSGILTDDEDEVNELIQVNENADIRVNTNYYTNPVSIADKAYNPENIIPDNIADNSQNIQNDIISNSDMSNLIEVRSVNVLINQTSTDSALVLSERRVAVSDRKVETKNKIKLPQNEENENINDSEIEEIPRSNPSNMRPIRNMNNANPESLVVKNVQIQQLECNIV